MTVDVILQALRDRNAVLYIEGGRLKYAGPKRAPDDPLRTAIDEHRAELITLFSPSHPGGWSNRLGRVTLEPVPDHPGQWQEPAASAGLCIWCKAVLPKGDPIACVEHRMQLDGEPRYAYGHRPTPALSVDRSVLLAIGERHCYPRLGFKPGESIAAGETAWSAFTRYATTSQLLFAAQAARATWSDDPMTYVQPDNDDDNPLSGCCPKSRPCAAHFDDFFEAYRNGQEDRYLEHGHSQLGGVA